MTDPTTPLQAMPYRLVKPGLLQSTYQHGPTLTLSTDRFRPLLIPSTCHSLPSLSRTTGLAKPSRVSPTRQVLSGQPHPNRLAFSYPLSSTSLLMSCRAYSTVHVSSCPIIPYRRANPSRLLSDRLVLPTRLAPHRQVPSALFASYRHARPMSVLCASLLLDLSSPSSPLLSTTPPGSTRTVSTSQFRPVQSRPIDKPSHFLSFLFNKPVRNLSSRTLSTRPIGSVLFGSTFLFPSRPIDPYQQACFISLHAVSTVHIPSGLYYSTRPSRVKPPPTDKPTRLTSGLYDKPFLGLPSPTDKPTRFYPHRTDYPRRVPPD